MKVVLNLTLLVGRMPVAASIDRALRTGQAMQRASPLEARASWGNKWVLLVKW